MNKNLNFSNLFRKANILSILAVLISILFIFFKGLNFGIDFKGGTLIEIRIDQNNIGTSEIRNSLSKMNLGDINVKEFGKKGDFLIKIEKASGENKEFISTIKKNISEKLQSDVSFRRVENVRH